MRRFSWMALVAALVAVTAGCGDDEKRSERQTPSGSEVPQPTVAPGDAPRADGLRTHLDLQALVHLADVDQGGLLIDFGSPARMKYTSGAFKTGWLHDGADGKRSFTHVGASGRLYAPIEQAGPVELRIALKAIGTKNLQLFVNNTMLPAIKLEQAGFAEYAVALPQDVIKAGENHVLLRFGGTTRHEGQDVAAAVDYVKIGSSAKAEVAGASAHAGSLATYDTLLREVAVAGSRSRALTLATPSTLSYYLEIPEQASLALRVAMAKGEGGKATVNVTAEGEAPVTVLSKPLSGDWQDGLIALHAFAGKTVRLDLTAESTSGVGEVAWSAPSVLVPEVKLASKAQARNVIVLLIDTLPAKKLRAYNPKSRVETAALDAFVREATLFERAQSPENWTKPAVASVLTGLYPMTHRTKESDSKLPDSALMVSEVFKKEGFRTGTFLANGYVSDKFGFNQGWDHYTNYIRENRPSHAESVFKEAGDFIEKNKSDRFFVYIQTIDPHVPYDPPEEYLKKYDPEPYTGIVSPRKTPDQLEQAKRNPPKLVFNDRDRERLHALYDGEVTYHDDHFAKFITRLRELGLYDQTLFVITSDHGEEFYEHGSYGHGHSVYQEMIHVPLMMRLPGTLPAGKRVPEAVGTLDIAPTVLAATGIAIPEVMEGIDRLPHAQGRPPAQPAVAFSDFLDDRRTIRTGRYKLVLRGINATLFDLVRDPDEQAELPIDKHPIAMRYCRTLLGQFLGARDRLRWIDAEQKKSSAELAPEATEIDEKTREHLKALGYAN